MWGHYRTTFNTTFNESSVPQRAGKQIIFEWIEF